ncbi:MAG: redox-regulated ATPase YchF [Planctomycetes bacterium]|nr:redox-regulated ATPase YchF [Planctomycetota bacterium]
MADRPIAARVGLLGVSGAGKTTLFAALTGTDYSRALVAGGKSLAASVRVEDPRLLRMHQVEGAHKKLVTPILEIVDGPPIALSGPEKQDNPGVLSQFRECDAYLAVLKSYDGSDPKTQIEGMKGELFLGDVESMNRRIERLQADVKKPLPNREELQRELAALQHLSEGVLGGDTKVFEKLTPEDEKRLRGFQFYSRKPIVPLANVGETQLGTVPGPATSFKLETELLAMEPSEREMFMKEYGLASLVVPGLANLLYRELGFVTFATVGDKDVTAWHLRKGASAWDAAGRIHTDIQRGFINCEVVSFADWEKFGDYHEARSHGKARTEGKSYVMQDFDIIHIKFNV